MNLTQAAVRSSLLNGISGPVIVSRNLFSAAAASVTVDIPRLPKGLVIVTAYGQSASAAPSTISGFTVLTGAGAGRGAQYRFLNGTEAATAAITITGATSSKAWVYLIQNATSTIAPVGNVAANTSASTISGPSITVPNGAHPTLLITDCEAFSATGFTKLPVGFSPQTALSAAGMSISLYKYTTVRTPAAANYTWTSGVTTCAASQIAISGL